MSRPTPTAEQLTAIQSQAKSLVVTASAGAGKTFVLVERYLRHVLEDGLTPDQILTITFTKKAAAEMKHRIVAALREMGKLDQAQIAETGPIQTIHSFCERLLRENALAAGLDPEFSILADSQLQRILTESARSAMADPDLSPYADDLISVLVGKRADKSGSPYSAVEGAIKNVLSSLRSSGANIELLEEQYKNPGQLLEVWCDAIRSTLHPSVRLAMNELDDDMTFVEAINRASKSVKMPAAWARSNVTADELDRELALSCGLMHLVLQAWWRLESQLDRMQAVDFTGLEARAERLLRNSHATSERIGSQFKVLMVDEGQDINPIQDRLLELMPIGRRLMVGDMNQSIYGFRQADVEIFSRRMQSSEVAKLTFNHRSEPGIVNFVDHIFKRAWTGYERMRSDPTEDDLDKVVSIVCDGVEFWDRDALPYLETAQQIRQMIQEDCVAPGSITVLVRKTDFGLKLVEALRLVDVQSRVVGGSERFFARMEIRDMANALQSVADSGDDLALLSCLHGPVAGLSLDSIVQIGMEPNVIERVETFDPVSEEDRESLRRFLRWYLPLMRKGDRLSAWEVLSEVLSKSDYLVNVARRIEATRQIANVRKLLALAAIEPELGPFDFAEQIREIQRFDFKEGDAPAYEDDSDVVKVMTIHKAKGLEFETVVLPQTDAKPFSDKTAYRVDTRLGLVATKFLGPSSFLVHFVEDRVKRAEQAEELRLLYVALTRAKKRLCVTMPKNPDSASLAKKISTFVGKQPLPGIRVRTLSCTTTLSERSS
jgi:ATP-dependent helicase/nuclease subunit A